MFINLFPYERFHTRTRFETKATRNASMSCSQGPFIWTRDRSILSLLYYNFSALNSRDLANWMRMIDFQLVMQFSSVKHQDIWRKKHYIAFLLFLRPTYMQQWGKFSFLCLTEVVFNFCGHWPIIKSFALTSERRNKHKNLLKVGAFPFLSLNMRTLCNRVSGLRAFKLLERTVYQ